MPPTEAACRLVGSRSARAHAAHARRGDPRAGPAGPPPPRLHHYHEQGHVHLSAVHAETIPDFEAYGSLVPRSLERHGRLRRVACSAMSSAKAAVALVRDTLVPDQDVPVVVVLHGGEPLTVERFDGGAARDVGSLEAAASRGYDASVEHPRGHARRFRNTQVLFAWLPGGRGEGHYKGCVHSKLFLAEYDAGVRVVVSTCNLDKEEYEGVSEMFYVQDFPRKTASAEAAAAPSLADSLRADRFGLDLSVYVARLLAASSDARDDALHPEVREWRWRPACFDYRSASADLVCSWPQTGPTVLRADVLKPGEVGHFSFRLDPALREGDDPVDCDAAPGSFACAAEAGVGVVVRDAAGSSVGTATGFYGDQMFDALQRGYVAARFIEIEARTTKEGDSYFWMTAAAALTPALDRGFAGVLRAADGRTVGGGGGAAAAAAAEAAAAPAGRLPDDEILARILALVERPLGALALHDLLDGGAGAWPAEDETSFYMHSPHIVNNEKPQAFLAQLCCAVHKKKPAYKLHDAKLWNIVGHPLVVAQPCMVGHELYGKVVEALRVLGLLRKYRVAARSDGAAMPEAFSHAKVFSRRFETSDGRRYGWLFIGSQNMSTAAWGVFSQETVLGAPASVGQIRNWELGVVFRQDRHALDAAFGSAGDAAPGFIDRIKLPFEPPGPEMSEADLREAKQRLLQDHQQRQVYAAAAEAYQVEQAVEASLGGGGGGGGGGGWGAGGSGGGDAALERALAASRGDAGDEAVMARVMADSRGFGGGDDELERALAESRGGASGSAGGGAGGGRRLGGAPGGGRRLGGAGGASDDEYARAVAASLATPGGQAGAGAASASYSAAAARDPAARIAELASEIAAKNDARKTRRESAGDAQLERAKASWGAALSGGGGTVATPPSAAVDGDAEMRAAIAMSLAEAGGGGGGGSESPIEIDLCDSQEEVGAEAPKRQRCG